MWLRKKTKGREIVLEREILFWGLGLKEFNIDFRWNVGRLLAQLP